MTTAPDAVGRGLGERRIEPAQVGAGAVGDLLRLRGRGGRGAVPGVGVVVRAAGHVDGDEQDVVCSHITFSTNAPSVACAGSNDLRLRQHLLLVRAQRSPGRREEDRTDQREVGDRVAAGVVDQVAVRVVDVVDLPVVAL